MSIYLFDWGNTLMVDFPDQSGKMCHWPEIACVDGAKETLAALSAGHDIYVATGAADSSEAEIRLAFDRAGLAQYISGYFCQDNLGVGKGSTRFYELILGKLGVDGADVVMVGDDLQRDILPAMVQGISGVLFALKGAVSNEKYRVITRLEQLINSK